MEKEKKVNFKKDNVKKVNINMKNKDFITKIKDFYNEKIKKGHIITLIIVTILFSLSFFSSINSAKAGAVATPISFVEQIKECFLLTLVILIAGITPYIPLSVFGVAQAVLIVNDMALRYAYGISFGPTLFIGGLIQMIGISLSVVLGMYYCKLTTKKNKYYHHSDFGMDDVKMQFYEIRKDEKKLDEIKKKKEAKAKEIEACNIKIPYLNLISLSVLAFVFEFIGIVITKI